MLTVAPPANWHDLTRRGLANPQEKNMRKVIVTISIVCLGLALFVLASHAQQDKSKRPSPPATASLDLGGGKSITIDYSSPRLKGRHVGQEIAPYGQFWSAITPSSRFPTKTSGRSSSARKPASGAPTMPDRPRILPAST